MKVRVGRQPGLQLHQWAWEFLRRNEDYRALVRPLTAAQGSRIFFNEIEDALSERLWSEFWLLFAINPELQGEAFPLHWWHGDRVPLPWQTQPNYGLDFEGATEFKIFYVKRNLTRQHQHDLLDDLLDELDVPEVTGKKGRPFGAENFPRNLRAFDLWKAHHLTAPGSSASMTYQMIGEAVEPQLPAHVVGGRAQEAISAAAAMVQGGYRSLLERPLQQTDFFPATG